MMRSFFLVPVLALAIGCSSLPKVSETAARYLSVDASGRFELKDKIHFETGSAKLDPKSNDLLDAVALVLAENQRLKISIAGHTDNQGDAGVNQRLSQSRAESVARYLQGKGVAADRLAPKGYGDARPIASNDTSAGRGQNRRVEFSVAK